MQDEAFFRAALTRQQALPDSEWRFFAQQVKQRDFAKSCYLVRVGEPPGDFHFITRGLVQLCYPSEQGRIIVKSFAREGEMTGPLLSWLEGSTSPIDIQAIEPTKTLGFPSSLVPKLVARSPAWNGILKTHLEALAHRTEQRALSLLEHTPEARYRQFMAEEPQLCERLSLKQIAAYLGITDVSLSRIRRRLNKG